MHHLMPKMWDVQRQPIPAIRRMRRMLLSVDLLTVRILDTAIESELNRRLSPLDLTYVQGSVLGLLDREGSDETSQNTVERWLGLSRPTVAGILRRLEAKGLLDITPHPHDRRRHRVVITPEGRRLAHEVSRTVSTVGDLVLADFTTEEIATLEHLLERAAANLPPHHPTESEPQTRP